MKNGVIGCRICVKRGSLYRPTYENAPSPGNTKDLLYRYFFLVDILTETSATSAMIFYITVIIKIMCKVGEKLFKEIEKFSERCLKSLCCCLTFINLLNIRFNKSKGSVLFFTKDVFCSMCRDFSTHDKLLSWRSR